MEQKSADDDAGAAVEIMRNERSSGVVPFVTRSMCSTAMQPTTVDTYSSFRFMTCRDEAGETKSQQWPDDSGGVDCWTCAHPFAGRPCFIPSRRVSGAWKVYGCFCSWSCAKRYVIDHPSFENSGQIILLEDLARASGTTGPVVASPPMIALRRFGGYLSIEEYRSDAETVVDVVHEPFISHSVVFRHAGAVAEEAAEEEGEGRREAMDVDAPSDAVPPSSAASSGRVHGLRRPARTRRASVAEEGSSEAHTGGGVYGDYVSRRRLLSQQRQRGGEGGGADETPDEERRPARRRKREAPAPKQRKKSGTLVAFMRQKKPRRG